MSSILRTIGIIIGTLNVLLFTVCTGFLFCQLVVMMTMESSESFDRQKYDIITIEILLITLCIILITSSCLLITGIVKRRPTLMLPWLIFSIFGFAINFRVLQSFAAFVIFALPLPVNGVELIIDLARVGISALIFCVIYHLYTEISKKGVEKDHAYEARHELL